MVGDGQGGGGDIRDRPFDLPGDGGGAPAERQRPFTLAGLLAASDLGDEYRRLYLSPTRRRWVDFRAADVADFGDVAPDRQPLGDQAGTWVQLEPTAEVRFSRVGEAFPPQLEVDLDPRLRPFVESEPARISPFSDFPTDACQTRGYRQTCRWCDIDIEWPVRPGG